MQNTGVIYFKVTKEIEMICFQSKELQKVASKCRILIQRSKRIPGIPANLPTHNDLVSVGNAHMPTLHKEPAL